MKKFKLKKLSGKTEHPWVLWIFEGLVVIGMLITIAYIYIARDYFGNPGELENWTYNVLDEGWNYTDSKGDIRSLKFPVTIEDDGSGTLVIRGRVPYQISDKYFISTRLLGQDARAYIGGSIRTNVYTKNDASPHLKDKVSRFIYIPLHIDDGGREIEIELIGEPGKAHAISEIVYGEKIGIVTYYLKTYALAFILAIFLLAVSVVSIVLGVVFRVSLKTKLNIDYMGWALFLTAVWSMTQTSYRDLLFNDARAISIVPVFCLMMLPMALALYMNSIQEGRYSKTYMIFLTCSMLHVIIITFLQFAHIYDFHQAAGSSMAFLFILWVVFMFTSYIDYKKGRHKDYTLVIVGTTLLGICGGIQGISYAINPYSSNPLPLSMGTFILNILAVTHAVRMVIRMDSDKNTALNTAELKGQFLANMSHEIRTPINAILGMNEMILRESSEQTIKNYATDVDTSGRYLLSLINDILDFSKLDSGKMTIVPEEYEFKKMVLNCYHLNEKRAKEKNLDFILDVDSNLPRKLFGDEIRVSQVITNLVTNAIKYTKEGRVGIKIFGELPAGDMDYGNILEGNEDGKDISEKNVNGKDVNVKSVNGDDIILLKVMVSDTGIGIQDTDKDKLFSAFARLDEKKNKSIEGTGLGLAITGELVKLMKGEIKVESTYGSGSVFTLTLPQKITDAAPVGIVDVKTATVNVASRISGDLFTAPDAHVMVVDDVSMNLKVFCGLLKKTLIQIDTASSGDEAIEKAKNNKYDVIFLDHMMPNKDGVETFHEIKALSNKLNADTPVIMLTANAVAGAREQFLEEGFNDFLAKPFTLNEVQTTLLKYLPDDLIKEA